MVYNLTTFMSPSSEKPWLEPYDSTIRMTYYLFENNKRLRYVPMDGKTKEEDLSLYLRMVQYPNEAMKAIMRAKNLAPNATVPVTESCLRIFSAKNETARMELPGLFDEILKLPIEIWIGVVTVFSILTTIEIVEKRMAGIRRTIISCAYDNLFQQFGALLGKGYDISPLPAIRVATGIWFLQIVVLFTLLCAVITANFSTKHRKNIDSVTDFERAPSYLRLFAEPIVEYDICQSTIEEMKIACESIQKSKNDRFPQDFLVFIGPMIDFVTASETSGWFNFEKGMYMSSREYLCQPLIYLANQKINPTAFKLVNNGLRSFVETSHITPWHRHLEKRFGFDIRPKPRSFGGNEFRKIEWKDVKMAFAVWATQLGVAFLVAMIESILGLYHN